MKARLVLLASAAVLGAAGQAAAGEAPPRVGMNVAGVARAGQRASTDCAALAGRVLPNAKVTRAEAVAAGPFTVPGPAGPGAPSLDLPAFCRVAATLSPTSDSDIRMELWLPAGWNGKFMMVGNGGWNGSISYAAMGEPLRRGYAVASTDTGHQGVRGSFAVGHPEKLVDWAYRAVHLTAVNGKTLSEAYYGGSPRFSYWNGCSSGGRQGLKAVQMYPADFDGVIAGAPANNWMRQQARWLSTIVANLPKGGQAVLGPEQFALLNRAVVARCDERDGLKDGQVQDPRACDFKPASLICKAGEAASACLTAAQADTADRIYGPLRDPRTGALLSPGMAPGSEGGWAGGVSRPSDVAVDTYALAAGRADWDFYTLDPARDLAAAERWDPGIDAVNPDLTAFKARGGKLLQYHGWADPLIPTEMSINYYEAVAAKQGGLAQTQDFYRLFLVPAMGHCNGAYVFDWIATLEQWVEGGQAPDVVIADHVPPPGVTPAPPPPGAVVFAPQYGFRPMCAYPAVAKLQSGNGEQPLDWMCLPAPRGARAGHAPPRLGTSVASR